MGMTEGTEKLVSSGTPSGWSGPVSLYLYYKVKSQSVENNQTVLSLGMYVTTPNGWYFGPWKDYNGSYIGTATSGDNCKTFDGSCPAKTQGVRWLVQDQDITVTHESDGTKNVTIYWQWGINSGWTGIMNCPSGSFTIALPTIPRASTIDSIACATKYFTGTMTFKYTPKSSAYYNRCDIALRINGASTAVKSISLGQQTASQKAETVTLSDSELSIIYNKIPSATEGTLRFTFRTYSDSDYSTQVGDERYKEITLYIPDDSTTKASVLMSLTPVSSLPSVFDGLYIQGKTKVKGTLSATGKFGATIQSHSMKVDGNTYDSDDSYTSGYLANYGDITVYGYAKDSRGFTGSISTDIKVIAYSKPKITVSVCERCDEAGNLSDGGTYLKIIATRSYSDVTSDGVQKNFCKIQYRYKVAAASSYSAWTTILDSSDVSTNTVETNALLGTFSKNTSYMVQVRAVDDIGDYAEATISVPTEAVHSHRTSNGIGFGKYCEGENLMDVAWDAHFHGEIRLGAEGITLREYILAVISEGG